MATIFGTGGPDTLSTNLNETNTFFGFGGDDIITGGRGVNHFFGGAGADDLTGGPVTDYYYYVASYQSIYIFDFESVGINTNRNDFLRLHTPLTPFTNFEYFGLEFIQDTYFVLPGETSDLAFPNQPNVETNAFIKTDTGVIEIYDLYGDSGSGSNAGDEQDGIERISIYYENGLGNLISRTFSIGDEYQPFSGTQGGTTSAEFFFGTRGDDTIYGNGGDDLIMTGDGDDVIFGGTGLDHIIAARGDNLLDGGSSGDFYYWNTAYTARNMIQESTTSDDDSLIASFTLAKLGGAEIVGSGPVRDLRLFLVDPTNPGGGDELLHHPQPVLHRRRL